MPPRAFRFPGVLNSQELLVAEAILARAWRTVASTYNIPGCDEAGAKARLGGIVARLMSDRSKSIGDLADAAISAFRATASGSETDGARSVTQS